MQLTLTAPFVFTFQENAALCDQVTYMQEKILHIKEENNFFSRKLKLIEFTRSTQGERISHDRILNSADVLLNVSILYRDRNGVESTRHVEETETESPCVHEFGYTCVRYRVLVRQLSKYSTITFCVQLLLRKCSRSRRSRPVKPRRRESKRRQPRKKLAVNWGFQCRSKMAWLFITWERYAERDWTSRCSFRGIHFCSFRR